MLGLPEKGSICPANGATEEERLQIWALRQNNEEQKRSSKLF